MNHPRLSTIQYQSTASKKSTSWLGGLIKVAATSDNLGFRLMPRVFVEFHCVYFGALPSGCYGGLPLLSPPGDSPASLKSGAWLVRSWSATACRANQRQAESACHVRGPEVVVVERESQAPGRGRTVIACLWL